MSGGFPHLLEESAVASVTAKETPSAEQDLLSAEFSTTCAGGSVAPEALPLWQGSNHSALAELWSEQETCPVRNLGSERTLGLSKRIFLLSS